MLLEDYFETDTLPDCRRIRVKGTRIAIEYLLEPYLNGDSPERIYQSFRQFLSLEQVHATITYYYHDKEKLDAYMDECRNLEEALYQEYLKQGPSEPMRRIRAMAERVKVAKEK